MLKLCVCLDRASFGVPFIILLWKGLLLSPKQNLETPVRDDD
jgi:hypothetical protein